MNEKKYKYLIITPSIFIFFGIFFPVINLIRFTLNSNPLKNNNNSKSITYSYEILSSDNKILSKLSRKFDVLDDTNSIPFFLKYSFISGEDKRFFKHNGIDLIGLSRALINNIQSRSFKEGGSTITQQVARLIFLNNDLSFQRKIKEMIISLILDFKYSKSQILKLYLNNIYLGSGAYGVNEASQVYFGKFINELTLSEVALIAGLAPAPSIYSPYENIDLAIKQRNKILESMYLDGHISLGEKDSALQEKVKLNYQIDNKNLNDKLLVNYILEEANKIIKTHKKYKFLKIKSSINKNWQEIGQHISKYIGPNNIEIALVSIESNTGLIRTMITSKNPSINEFNRVTSAVRPLGSTFKIIPYAAALIEGRKLSDKFEDIPTCWKDYCPNNFSENYLGKISLTESFKKSSNIVPLKIANNIGLKKIINLANLFGLGYEQKLEEFLPLAIGSYGDNLLNITNAYAVLNSNGNLYKPSIIEKIESKNQELIWENKFVHKKILAPKVNKNLNNLLEKSVSEGTSIGASIKGERIFGKTGTSDENRDLWFIGSIKNLTTGVWIGFDENKKSNLSSGNAAYFWKKFISKIFDLKIQ
ncbi:putative penicillin binding protein [Prochlorococcus marinus str. MIT 9515]|uniref:Putative penicillin binding protein n=1 Tax=Prochlorococcus marinus (strain MIT 9515) TaxID=167542 RepID=A2BV87_PROM5|nr:transglycosylase domain-containing protein [Prochlorococcus marinus]ABM71698.1 putative penicillin binding protein [Prochlorococcus marinus str. MIT 9515]